MAKKKYHQSHMDREHEHEGMMKHSSKHHMAQGRHEAHESRRHGEMSEAGMIKEDHNAIANLPQEVVMKPYPYAYSYEPEEYDDTIRGVDRQLSMDDSKRNKHWNPHKY